MNHFSCPLTIVQINIFVEPQNIFPNQNPRPKLSSQPPPRIFNYRVPPLGEIRCSIQTKWGFVGYAYDMKNCEVTQLSQTKVGRRIGN